jgi:hypothetical protein
LANDTGALDNTYGEWLHTAEQAVADLRSNGVLAMKVPLEVEEAAAWCRKQRRAFDSAGRAAFVAPEAGMTCARASSNDAFDGPFGARYHVTRELTG